MYLPKAEIIFYFIVYVFFLLYGIYQIYMLSDGKSIVFEDSFSRNWK